MKKLGILSAAFVLVLSISGAASAASYGFSDTIDNWGSDGAWGRVPILNWLGTYEYQHDIKDAWNNRKFSFLQFDHSSWQAGDGVDNSNEFLTAMNWFGPILPRPHWRKPWPERPRRFGRPRPGSPAPVPEPCTMILLGMGVVGIAVPGRKKIFKVK